MAKQDGIEKRKALAAKIKDIAPHIDVLVGLMSDSQVDIALVVLSAGVVKMEVQS